MKSVFEDVRKGALEPGQKTWISKAQDKVADKFHEICHDQSLEDYSEATQRFLGPLIKMCGLALLGFFLWYNYQNDRTSQFLSLDGSSSSQNCVEVALAITGTFSMDVEGYWSGNTLYNPSRAVYSFEMNNFKHTTVEFEAIIADLKTRIDTVSKQAPTRGLTDNLLYWMSWAQIIDDNNETMRLQFTGAVENVFDTMTRQAVLGGVAADCRAIPTVSYNVQSGVLDVTYSAQSYSSEVSCTTISDASNLGYLADYDGDNFNLQVDMRSIVTALAVNKGVLSYSSLVSVRGLVRPGVPTNVTYNNILFNVVNKIDSRYEGMVPLVCFEAQSAPTASSHIPTNVCMVKMVGIYAYPFFTHKGLAGQSSVLQRASKYVPDPCTCPTSNTYCSTFDFIAGLVIFAAQEGTLLSVEQQFSNTMDMVVSAAKQSPSATVDQLAYDASFTSLVLGNGKLPAINQSSLSAVDLQALQFLTSSTFRQSAYKFCGNKCSLLSINFYDPYTSHINADFRSLDLGACSDSFSAPNASWALFEDGDNPPTPLVQDYNKCTYSVEKAAVDSVGVSMGNVSALMTPLIVVFVALAAAAGVRRPRPPHEELYDAKVAQRAAAELATYLLLVRDGRAVRVQDAELVRCVVDAFAHPAPAAGGGGGSGLGGSNRVGDDCRDSDKVSGPTPLADFQPPAPSAAAAALRE